MTFVPNRVGNDKNTNDCKILAEQLELPMFSYLDPKPGSESLTEANTQIVREERIQHKFVVHQQNVPDIPCAILFDDSMKSGTTLDYAGEVLMKRGLLVVAIVTNLWELKELPEPELLPL